MYFFHQTTSPTKLTKSDAVSNWWALIGIHMHAEPVPDARPSLVPRRSLVPYGAPILNASQGGRHGSYPARAKLALTGSIENPSAGLE